MTASLGPVLEAGTVAAVLVLAAAGFAAWMAWRAVHRRWRRLRNHAATQTALAVWGVASSLEARRLLAGDLAGLTTLRASRRMWRSVELAEKGVRHAEAVGAPTGDLAPLCRRLRAVATDVQRSVELDAGAAGGVRSGTRAQMADVMAAAHDLQLAASTAVGDVSGPRAQELAFEAQQEAQALTAGLVRARQLTPERP